MTQISTIQAPTHYGREDEEDRAATEGQSNIVPVFFGPEQPDALRSLQSRIESAARRILAGGTCPDCEGTLCSKCGKCHFCEDVDLPCVRRHINEIMSAIALRAHAMRDQGVVMSSHRQAFLLSNAGGWQIIRRRSGPRWPEGGAGCPVTSPSLPRRPRSGAAVAQPQAQEQQREVVLCL